MENQNPGDPRDPSVLPITIIVGTPPAITSAPTANFATSGPNTFTVLASGYPAPTFSVTSGTLPEGVTLSPGGVLSGTPATSGTDVFTITASNGIDLPASQTFTLVDGFGVVPVDLAPATRGTPYVPAALSTYGVTPSASGYTTTLSWAKVALPKGLSITKAGVISGIPNAKLAAGPTTLTVKVTEQVTTVVKGKPVKTKSTAQITLSLTIG